jgi:hypothetical protein
LEMKYRGLTSVLFPRLLDLSLVEDVGILGVGVKSFEIKRNAGGESGHLGQY